MENISEDEEVVICSKVIDKFKPSSQVIKAMEEMAELTQALSKFLLDKEHNVEEEIADVEIMLTQLKIMFDMQGIENWKEYKLNRLKELL